MTLHDGRVVSSYSEAWRLECEALTVLAMPTQDKRRAYMDWVDRKRGAAAHKALNDQVWSIWEARKREREAKAPPAQMALL